MAPRLASRKYATSPRELVGRKVRGLEGPGEARLTIKLVKGLRWAVLSTRQGGERRVTWRRGRKTVAPMGLAISSLYNYLLGGQQYKVVMVGLDNAGVRHDRLKPWRVGARRT